MSRICANSANMKIVLLDELQSLLSAESDVRKSAEEHIRHLEFTEGISEIRKNKCPFPLI